MKLQIFLMFTPREDIQFDYHFSDGLVQPPDSKPFYHGIHHHFSPPFGKICLELFPSIEESQIHETRWKSDEIAGLFWRSLTESEDLGGGFKWGRFPVWLIFFKWVETTRDDFYTGCFFDAVLVVVITVSPCIHRIYIPFFPVVEFGNL